MIPTGASVRPLPRRKGPRGIRQVEVSPGRWMDEAVAEAQGIPLVYPLPSACNGPVVVRREAPEVTPVPETAAAPRPPARGPGAPPSENQERAWKAVTERGLYWPDVARELGTTSWAVKNMIAAYMRRNGIPGEPPGRTPKDETARRTLLAKGQTPKPSGVTSGAPGSKETRGPVASVEVAERLVLAPEGHPWATDPEPIALVNPGPGLVKVGADHAETIPVAEREPARELVGDLDSEHRNSHAAALSSGGEPEPVASPAKGTPSPHHPAPQVLEDPESTDQAPAAPEVDAAAAIARLARERDEMEMARDEIRELLADARSDRERYLDALLAGLSTHPTDNIRDRIERALGITVDRDAWADGYRRALGDVLDIVRGTRGTTYPQVDIIEKVARLAIDVPAA